MIDKIYVQERTDTTDADCTAAKEAWDALTDAQKELVEGEEASPEYFGRDTGDASKDDPRNADEIGDNEILVVSFGTSFNDSRAEDIKGIEDAKKDGAELLEPTTDTVTYKDGMSEEVYGFDIPVPAIGEEFTVAAIGKKGKWYDHKVSVKNPVKDEGAQAGEGEKVTAEELGLEDGEYTADVTLEGGSGRATVDSPANLVVKDGEVTATIVWSSPNYDYMLVGGEKYEPVNTEGNSTFEIPVDGFDYPMEVVADTVAMSEPHEIEYTLTFNLNK